MNCKRRTAEQVKFRDELDRKECIACNEFKDESEFNEKKDATDKLDSRCNKCKAAKGRERFANHRPCPEALAKHKCTKCGAKAADGVHFWKDRRLKTGLKSLCVECQTEYNETFRTAIKGKPNPRVYILGHPAYPGIYKVGYTKNELAYRTASAMSTCPVAPEFLAEYPHPKAKAIEKRIHHALENMDRERVGGEWFRCDLSLIETLIGRELRGESNGQITSSDNGHRDRRAEADDCVVHVPDGHTGPYTNPNIPWG